MAAGQDVSAVLGERDRADVAQVSAQGLQDGGLHLLGGGDVEPRIVEVGDTVGGPDDRQLVVAAADDCAAVGRERDRIDGSAVPEEPRAAARPARRSSAASP